MVEYYLTYNIPAEVKDEMLETTTGDKRRNNITKLLLTHGAHINGDARSCCTKACIPTLENLHSLNYDFNWIDPETGNNLFMEYAGCPAPDGADDLIKTMQYLIDLGSKTNLKNKEGKTAYDMAVNKEVKAFLKSL